MRANAKAKRTPCGAVASHAYVAQVTTAATLVGLGLTGAMAARAGGAPPLRGAVRVMFWGALAMAAAALIGQLFDTAR